MEIGGKDYEQIIVGSAEDKVLAVISDNEVIEKDGIKVKLVPAAPEDLVSLNYYIRCRRD